jgi:hypothetical protein
MASTDESKASLFLRWFEMPELHEHQQVMSNLQRPADKERPGSKRGGEERPCYGAAGRQIAFGSSGSPERLGSFPQGVSLRLADIQQQMVVVLGKLAKRVSLGTPFKPLLQLFRQARVTL